MHVHVHVCYQCKQHVQVHVHVRVQNLKFVISAVKATFQRELRWLPRVIVKHPPYRARVRKGNVVTSS